MSSSIPQIDFSPFLEGHEAGKKQVASQIGKACREIGFFTLTDHGVSLELINELFHANREFHQQPLEEKEERFLISHSAHPRISSLFCRSDRPQCKAGS
ncbi:MAG: hypothetical protein CM15mP45_06400 [Deltaproteobacteria bacterium]|nr:MAG: hypothetical protein CM15mP45_06400 [Deltaproteobacteria bacterium]